MLVTGYKLIKIRSSPGAEGGENYVQETFSKDGKDGGETDTGRYEER